MSSIPSILLFRFCVNGKNYLFDYFFDCVYVCVVHFFHFFFTFEIIFVEFKVIFLRCVFIFRGVGSNHHHLGLMTLHDLSARQKILFNQKAMLDLSGKRRISIRTQLKSIELRKINIPMKTRPRVSFFV